MREGEVPEAELRTIVESVSIVSVDLVIFIWGIVIRNSSLTLVSWSEN